MAYSFLGLITAMLVFSLVQAQDINCEKSLSAHIRNAKPWGIGEPKNIHGNVTVARSLAWTWTNNESEVAINKQINKELFAHYNYLSMASHFDRDDIMLPGFAKFFREAAMEELKHAQMFMAYQNRRGGRVKLNGIMKPCRDQWGNGRVAMIEALNLEKLVYYSLMDLHRVAENNHDHQMMDFIESKFLDEQIESIKILSNYINTLNRAGDGLGEYQFDKTTLGGQ